jgi:hypothetical protein
LELAKDNREATFVAKSSTAASKQRLCSAFLPQNKLDIATKRHAENNTNYPENIRLFTVRIGKYSKRLIFFCKGKVSLSSV